MIFIRSARYLISSGNLNQCPPADKPEFAFIGRSNVGKSSLINMLTGNARLAKISSAPGKTKLINHFIVESAKRKKQRSDSWYLVDLPGYGYAKTAQKERQAWSLMIEDYLRHRNNLITVFILIDARHEPQAIDLEFIDRLGEWEIPFVLVFTKADKEKPAVVERNIEAFKMKMKAHWDSLPECFITSSVKGEGKDLLLEFIGQRFEQIGY